MINFNDGQCGHCQHFGEHHQNDSIVQIRINGEAPDGFVTECGHPNLENLHLQVSPNGSCDGFKAA